MSLLSFFRSAYEISVDATAGDAVLDFLVSQNIPFHRLAVKNDILSFHLYPPYFAAYEKARGEERFPLEKRRQHGFFSFVKRHKKRAGFYIGAAFAAFLIVFSSLFVWDVDVHGTERLSEEAIRTALEEQGLRLGVFIPSLNKERLEQELMLDMDGLSWISINLRGTVANVEVHERKDALLTQDTQSPSNLIASMDGQIHALQITGGQTIAKLGQIVKKGDLLVSGAIDSKADRTSVV